MEDSIKNFEKPKIYHIDLSKGWDTVEQLRIFMRALRKLPFYRPGLLYSGFDYKTVDQALTKENIYCGAEEDFTDPIDIPLLAYADSENPTIAVYDSQKMKKVGSGETTYKPTDPSALIALIRVKFAGN